MKNIIGSGLLAVSMLAGSAMASDLVTSPVNLYRYSNGTLFINVWNKPGQKPACASSEQWDYRVDLSEQNIALIRLFRDEPDEQRTFKGTGDCTGDVENLKFVQSAPDEV